MEVGSNGEVRVISGVGHVSLEEGDTSISHRDSYMRKASGASGQAAAENEKMDEPETEMISKIRSLLEREGEKED